MSVTVKKGFFSFAKKVAELGQGMFFGETSLVTREPRNATVTADEATSMFVLTSVDFNFVLDKNPSFKAEIKRIAERRKFRTRNENF